MMRMGTVVAILVTGAVAGSAAGGTGKTGPWDLRRLSRVPKVFAAPEFKAPAPCRGLFLEGEPYQGKPTRVFAWYGAPADAGPDKRVPAMVLVHGGGGTAYLGWVQMWVKRGYAAIAMETCGCVPKRGEPVVVKGKPRPGGWQRIEQGGPPGWGRFTEKKPVPDHWTYHAVSAAVLAHSLVRSFPEVDAERTGVTGISWGGFLTSLVVGVDSRFKLAVPVYGCGRITKPPQWWDPSTYLANATMPILWMTGTNDFFSPMDQWQDSYRRAKGGHTLCLRVRMCHSHGCGWAPKEIGVFADSILTGGVPLATITGQGRDGNKAWATFTSKSPVVKAELNYTEAVGVWKRRPWKTVPATLDPKAGRVSADVPTGATVYYFNLIDGRGCLVSTEHVVTAKGAKPPLPKSRPVR